MLGRKLDINKSLVELAEEGWTAKELFEAVGLGENSEVEVEKVNLTARVTEILHEIGVPAHIVGYPHLRCAIERVVKDGGSSKAITKVLYPEIAKQFKCTAPGVERGIRHAIERAWNQGDLENLKKYFGNTISRNKGKPTNREFIAMIADTICLEGYGADQ